MISVKALKVFKDLVAFLTIIPLAKDESFAESSAKYMFLFPLLGGFIGLLTAAYFQLCIFTLSFFETFLRIFLRDVENLFVRVFYSGATISFLLVLTGLQHLDGLIDFGNAIGLKNLEERRFAAHAWIVTYKGAFMAVFVEFLTFLGIFLMDVSLIFNALICAEALAKLAMVTLAWAGKPAYEGLGALFVRFNMKSKFIIVSYAITAFIVLPLLGPLGAFLMLVCFIAGLLLEKASEKLFGGTSGDVLGATNEFVRAACLLITAGVAK